MSTFTSCGDVSIKNIINMIEIFLIFSYFVFISFYLNPFKIIMSIEYTKTDMSHMSP